MALWDAVKDAAKTFDPRTSSGRKNILVGAATGGLTVPVQAIGGAMSGGDLGKYDPTKVPGYDFSQVEASKARLQQRADALEKERQGFQRREAPQVQPGQDIARTGVRNVSTRDLLGRGFDPSVAAAQVGGPKMSGYEQQALESYSGALQGQQPSAAEMQMRRGIEENARQAMALAQSRGMSPAAIRGAQYQMSQAGQQAALESAQLRAQEIAAARGGLMQGAQAQRAAEQQMAQYQAQLDQEANMYSKTQEGQMMLAQADAELKAQLANQGVDLEIIKQNAARGDAYAMANLEAQLKQAGMDDAMVLGYLQAITGLETGDLQANMQMAIAEQQRLAQSAQARAGITGSILGSAGSVLASAVGGA